MPAKNPCLIFGIRVIDRLRQSEEVQRLLSEYGRNIKTRIGLHQVEKNLSHPGGIILLEMVGNPDDCEKLAGELSALDGVEVQRMVFKNK